MKKEVVCSLLLGCQTRRGTQKNCQYASPCRRKFRAQGGRPCSRTGAARHRTRQASTSKSLRLPPRPGQTAAGHLWQAPPLRALRQAYLLNRSEPRLLPG